MAPLPFSFNILDLDLSSLELDSRSSSHKFDARSSLPIDLPSYLQTLSLTDREALTNPTPSRSLSKRDDTSLLSPIQAHSILNARSPATTSRNPGAGSIDPSEFNNKGIQAVFALIGVGFVLGSIWFFFWAKNGGFRFQKGDWDDYKSTVLRRKGPNGTTLSNATKSTRLGNGSVVGRGYSDHDGTETMTDMSSQAPVFKEKNKKSSGKKEKKENERDRVAREAKQAGWEGGHDNDVRAYRHEKVARVGGLNKDSDAMHYGTDYSETDPSVSNQTPSRSNGQRRASRSPEKRDRASRRDFSYGQDIGDAGVRVSPERPARYHSPSKNSTVKPVRPSGTQVPGSFGYAEPLDFSDVQSQNTRSYHHPIPGLSGQGRNNGFRRGRDELDD